MKIYIYDKESGEYLYSVNAQVNPKNQSEYICPPNSTRISPPFCEENEIAIFNGEYWRKDSDFRGLEQINVETSEITKVSEFGDLKDGYELYSNYILSDSYKNIIRKQELDEKRDELLFEMHVLDEKRVRALCEPSVKDVSTGETWLEYYNNQMNELRKKLSEVCNDA